MQPVLIDCFREYVKSDKHNDDARGKQIFFFYRKNNVQFAAVISRLQESPQCQRLPFMSFLLLPFQRITRIKMLIEVCTFA